MGDRQTYRRNLFTTKPGKRLKSQYNNPKPVNQRLRVIYKTFNWELVYTPNAYKRG